MPCLHTERRLGQALVATNLGPRVISVDKCVACGDSFCDDDMIGVGRGLAQLYATTEQAENDRRYHHSNWKPAHVLGFFAVDCTQKWID